MNRNMTNTIIDMLDKDDWFVGDASVQHLETGIYLWISGGRSRCWLGMFGKDLPPWYMRRKLWRAVERMKHRMLVKERYAAQEKTSLRNFDRQISR